MPSYTVATWTCAGAKHDQLGSGHAPWMRLLKRLDVSQASVSIYLLPFLGVLLSVATLHETVTATMLLGGSITLVGTFLITFTENPFKLSAVPNFLAPTMFSGISSFGCPPVYGAGHNNLPTYWRCL